MLGTTHDAVKAHPHYLWITPRDIPSWTCSLCHRTRPTTLKVRCDPCNHTECADCLPRSRSQIMTRIGHRPIRASPSGNHYCGGSQIGYHNQCQWCTGVCGPTTGCNCFECRAIDMVFHVPPASHRLVPTSGFAPIEVPVYQNVPDKQPAIPVEDMALVSSGPLPATMTPAQVRAMLARIAYKVTNVTEMQEHAKNTHLKPMVVLLFNAKEMSSNLLSKYDSLISQYKFCVTFFSMDCTDDVMSPPTLRQLLAKHEVGLLPCTLVFKNNHEAIRANGASITEFSQIEDYLHRFAYGSTASTGMGVVTSLFSKPSNIEEDQFRLKFMQSMGKMYPHLDLEIIKIQKVNNPTLEDAFLARQRKLASESRPNTLLFAFHATPSTNIPAICQFNLSASKIGTTDSGYFGKGFYFSTHADYCARYIHKNGVKDLKLGDTGKMILFAILPGKVFPLSDDSGTSLGMQQKQGYDSHVSPKGAEWVLFDNNHFVPRAVFEFKMVESVKKKVGGSYENYVK
ncbi:hypothetical protein HDU96_010802 [Phlyctochytrium bullatum]|nr:hypothetical protein HDU96_010802 [Phlyctochytrium bullatum]